jgi:hypothetical protein
VQNAEDSIETRESGAECSIQTKLCSHDLHGSELGTKIGSLESMSALWNAGV